MHLVFADNGDTHPSKQIFEIYIHIYKEISAMIRGLPLIRYGGGGGGGCKVAYTFPLCSTCTGVYP